MIILLRKTTYPLLLAMLFLLNSCSTKTFTSTQSWKPEYLHHLRAHRSQFLKVANLKIPNPPTNDSNTSSMELKTLLELQNKRTVHDEDLIRKALYNWQFKLGDRVISQLQKDGYPETALLIEKINPDIGQAIFLIKQKYNRVRPSFLDGRIKPSIPVPDHPAYPSGHSTEAHTYALIFCKLDPKNQMKYLTSAQDIAHIRELAGVHYPSDSEGGKILAKQIVEQLFESEEFRIQFEKAHKEFN